MKSVQFKPEKLDYAVAVATCFLLLAPAISAQQTTHRFWDKTNIILHSANAAAQVADTISTQDWTTFGFLSAGHSEPDFLNRGFGAGGG